MRRYIPCNGQTVSIHDYKELDALCVYNSLDTDVSPKQKQEKGANMYITSCECASYQAPSNDVNARVYSTNYNSNENSTQIMETLSPEKRHLLDRANEIRYTHYRKLEETFGLKTEDRPETYEDLIARIKSGKFELSKGTELTDEVDYWDGPLNGFTWKDPKVKSDKAGYKLAAKKVDAAVRAVKDEIVVADDMTTALEALRSFEAATFQ